MIQYQLDAEKEVIKDLERQYQAALNQINEKIRILQSDELTQSRIYQLNYQKALKGQVQGILEKLHGDEYSTLQKYLHDCYIDAFVGTMYNLHGQGMPFIIPIDQNAAVKAILTDSKIKDSLYETLGVDVTKLKKAISSEITRGIASNLTYQEIARNISNVTRAPLSRAKTIANTEGHRIQQASTYDAQNEAKAKGAAVVKQWDSSLDGATRPTHRKLDGQIREIDEPYEADGKKAMYPGGFGKPEEDIRCRCVSLTRARAALDADELKTLKDRAKFFDLDKSASFADFEKKYLKATKIAENAGKTLNFQGKNGIIQVRNLAIPTAKLAGYALNPLKAPDKAKAFQLALGYDQSNAEELLQNILDHLDESRFVEKGDAGYGMLYESIIRITGANGKEANVLTAWIAEGDKKRMTSVYVTDKKVKE